MLSRLALAAARPARATLRPVTLSPWIRTYAAKNKGGPRGNAPKPLKKAVPQAPAPKATQEKAQGQAAASKPEQTQTPETEAPKTPEAEAPKAPDEPVQFHKLPDLTRGIPSTLDAELENASPSSASDSALQTVEQRRSRRDREDTYIPTSERNRKWWTRFALGTALGGSVFGIMYMGRGWDDEAEAARHADIPNGWTPALWLQRVRARWGENLSYYQEPAFDKLLPDPDPSFERPYTLCLSLDELLVYSEWSREHGWRIAKRPGLDYFIRYLSQYYELVLFTTVPFAMGEPVMRKLDPFRFIMWPLFREATKFEDGEIVKDLSYLNRDLSKVIIIDTNAEHVRKQPENAIVLPPWKGESPDSELVGLIPFLEYIHTMQYSDVRKVLKSFDGKHIPTEFSRREAIARKEFNATRAAQGKSRKSGVGSLGSMLGMKSSNMSMMVTEGEQNPAEAFAQGKMLQDIARERGQRNYQLLEQQIKENGEMWLKEEQVAMEKAQQEAMSGMMGSFSGWFVPKQEKEKTEAEKP